MPPTDIQQRMMRRVVRNFLDKFGHSTPRQDLVIEFKHLNDLNELVSRRVFKTYSADDYLPTAAAFHNCGDAKTADLARQSIQTMAKVLQKQFLTRQTKFTREGLEEDAREINPQADRRTVELGIYLAPEFNLLSAYVGGNEQRPIIVPTKISELIVDVRNPDTLWDDHLKRCDPWLPPVSPEGPVRPLAPIAGWGDEQIPPRKDRKWSRDQKIGAAGLVLGIVAIIVAITVPESRSFLGLDKTQSVIVPAPVSSTSAPLQTLDTVTVEKASKAPVSSTTPKKPKTGRADWRVKQNWRQYLHVGMSKDEVRQLFGDPAQVSVSASIERWDYGTGEITFADGSLYAWSEPD